MDSTNSGKWHIVRVAAVIAACIITGMLYMSMARVLYENTANKHWKGKRYQSRVHNPWNNSMVDSCVQLLKTGDLVVRRGDDMTSYMLSKLNVEDKTYSHCGLVVVEGGYPYVYHSIGGEDNPDELMRKDSAHVWFSPVNNHAFAVYRYDMADSTINSLVGQLGDYYRKKKMFDMEFDMATEDRLYCSEMIYKAISGATGDKSYIPTAKNYGKVFVGVDNLYMNPHATPVCQIRYK